MLPPDHPAARFEGLTPIARLYEGEHGDVWKVDDRRGRSWALKYVTSEEPDVHAGLLLEAGLHSRLHDPGVVALRKVLTSSDGRKGLLMELIDGPCLADVLEERGQLPLDEALALFCDVVRAVRTVHWSGVVHRDLKPENIMLRPRRGGYEPVLVDFGLAKALPTAEGEIQGGMSMYYTTLGTPEYMAPEQADAPSRVDERADVFSLGCLLYELLTGHIAFDADDPDEAMAAAAAGRYVPPEQRADLPAPVVELVHALLAANPDDRPEHCTAILGLLRQNTPALNTRM